MIPDTPENRRKYKGFKQKRGGSWSYSKEEQARYQNDQHEKKAKPHREKAKKHRDANTAGVAANKKAIAAKPAAAPQPKPKGSMQIEPVKTSPEMSAAKQVVQNYQAGLKDGKTPWEQAQSNVNSSANPGQFTPATDDTPQTGQDQINQMKETGQDFADKYKLDLIKSGATGSSKFT